jgi:superfamily I DNA/RNA helicase
MAGSNFLEAAHVKDVLAILRWAENPRDAVAGLRALQLHPGIGPATARNLIDRLSQEGFAATALAQSMPPAAAFVMWPGFCRMIERLRDVARHGPAKSSWCVRGISLSLNASMIMCRRAPETSTSSSRSPPATSPASVF